MRRARFAWPWLIAACTPAPVAIELPPAAPHASILLAIESGGRATDLFAISPDGAGFHLPFHPAGPVLLSALYYDASVADLGLAPGRVEMPEPACRGAPPPVRVLNATVSTGAVEWSPGAPPPLSLPCLVCPAGERDGGPGICVASSTCARGFHEGGAACVREGCSPGFHEGGAGACVALDKCSDARVLDFDGACKAACTRGFADGGGRRCARIGTCSPGFHPGGGDACARPGACAPGYHLLDDGACVGDDGCREGEHDGGDRACVPSGGCSPGFGADSQGACFRLLSDPSMKLLSPRAEHTATLLPSGEVLITGGNRRGDLIPVASTELFDPRTLRSRPGPNLILGRSIHEATLLADGRVLIAGGRAGTIVADTMEVLDGGRWQHAEGTLPGWAPGKAVLPNGETLFVGGIVPGNIALEDAVRVGPFGAPLPNVRLASRRGFAIAVTLLDGRVLAIGGHTELGVLPESVSSEIYDPPSRAWRTVKGPRERRLGHTATLLASGEVLIAGGDAGSGRIVSTAEIFDPVSGEWRETASMRGPRVQHRALLLADGRVLQVGGHDQDGRPLDTLEIFDPTMERWTLLPARLSEPRFRLAVTALDDHRVLISGGQPAYDQGIDAVDVLEIAPRE